MRTKLSWNLLFLFIVCLSSCTSLDETPTVPKNETTDVDSNFTSLIEDFLKGQGITGSVVITDIDVKSYSSNNLLAHADELTRSSSDFEVLVNTVSFEMNGQDGFAIIGESDNSQQIYYNCNWGWHGKCNGWVLGNPLIAIGADKDDNGNPKDIEYPYNPTYYFCEKK